MGNYMTMKYPDIANGPGCRVSLFLSGCNHHCLGCFNPEAWDFDAGREFTDEVQFNLRCWLTKPEVSGLTILGGEPLDPANLSSTWRAIRANYFARLHGRGLPRCVHYSAEHHRRYEVAIYTGYTFETLLNRIHAGDKALADICRKTDILVDGPFIQDLKDISLRFRGSSNQRILDCRKSLDAGKAIWTDDPRWIGESPGN